MDDDRSDISIVVPTYREAENVQPLIERIATTLEPTGLSYRILIIDDDSADGIERLVGDLADRWPVELVVRQGPRDLSLAVVEGLQRARGNMLVVMDADLSHPPEKIPEMLDALRHPPCDFVIGSRFAAGGRTQGWGGHRRLNSYVASLLCRPLARGIRDPMAGFFALPRSTLERSEALHPIGYKIGLELMCRCACRHVTEVPITFHDRAHGQSKLDLGQQCRYLIHLDRLYRRYQRGWGLGVRPVLWGMLAVLGTLRGAARLSPRRPRDRRRTG